jgi:hypothetical protein
MHGMQKLVGERGGGGPRMHFSEGESRSRHFGGFLSRDAVVFIVYEVEDAAGIKRLIKAADPHIK